jgi:predicted ester cyclase
MSTSVDQANKELVWDWWRAMGHTPVNEIRPVLEEMLHPETAWFGPHPINELRGAEAVRSGFWEPLMSSFAQLRRHADVFLASESCGEHWVSACGYLSGRFDRDWLGIPATGRPAHVHFGEHYRLEAGRIVESYLILDIPSVMRQAGYQMLPPALGAEGGRVLAPPAGEGVLLTEQSELESRKTRQLVWSMIRSLRRYGNELASMKHASYWHPDMHWYGPTGIGSCYGLEQYEEFHAGPWTRAFPEADSTSEPGSGRLIGLENGEILAEGLYGALGVWDCVFSHHSDEYLGVPATGTTMTMRDFDWYRRDGRYLVQNWVPIDLIDILLQLGVDVMADLARERRAREQSGQGFYTPSRAVRKA